MKSFSSKSEMLEYGKSLGKCDKEIVSLDGKTVILCGTNLAYEDKISEIAETTITSVVKEFCLKKDITSDSVSGLRESILMNLRSIFDIEIVEAINEY